MEIKEKKYDSYLKMIRVVRFIAITFIVLFFLFMFNIDRIPFNQIGVLGVIIFAVTAIMTLFWLLMVCPRCDKLFFQKHLNSVLLVNTFMNPLSNKCLNCGLHLKKHDLNEKDELFDKNSSKI